MRLSAELAENGTGVTGRHKARRAPVGVERVDVVTATPASRCRSARSVK